MKHSLVSKVARHSESTQSPLKQEIKIEPVMELTNAAEGRTLTNNLQAVTQNLRNF